MNDMLRDVHTKCPVSIFLHQVIFYQPIDNPKYLKGINQLIIKLSTYDINIHVDNKFCVFFFSLINNIKWFPILTIKFCWILFVAICS